MVSISESFCDAKFTFNKLIRDHFNDRSSFTNKPSYSRSKSTWWHGHVDEQNNRKWPHKFCKTIESNSQKTLHTNMASVTSDENHQNTNWILGRKLKFAVVCWRFPKNSVEIWLLYTADSRRMRHQRKRDNTIHTQSPIGAFQHPWNMINEMTEKNNSNC